MDLKAELKKAKDAAVEAVRAAKEATKVAERTSYELGVMDIEARLAEGMDVVCKDYCTESWGVVMDRAGVPADSKLRRSENIFFLKDIREIPAKLPPPTALPLPPLEQPLIIQDSSLDAEVAIETEKGKEVQPTAQASQSEDQLTIKDMVSKVKDVEEANLQAVGSKGDSHPSKA